MPEAIAVVVVIFTSLVGLVVAWRSARRNRNLPEEIEMLERHLAVLDGRLAEADHKRWDPQLKGSLLDQRAHTLDRLAEARSRAKLAARPATPSP